MAQYDGKSAFKAAGIYRTTNADNISMYADQIKDIEQNKTQDQINKIVDDINSGDITNLLSNNATSAIKTYYNGVAGIGEALEKLAEDVNTENKPDDGWAKSDLDSSVQASLDLADSSIQAGEDASLGNIIVEGISDNDGKGLSTNDYTNEEKTKADNGQNAYDFLTNYKLNKLEYQGEQKLIVEGIVYNLDYIKGKADKIDDKVDKVEGKGLSTNDYTDDEKAKVAKVDSMLAVESVTAEKVSLSYNPSGTGFYSKADSDRIFATKESVTQVGTNIGTMSELDTDATTLVGAINEVYGSLESINTILTEIVG